MLGVTKILGGMIVNCLIWWRGGDNDVDDDFEDDKLLDDDELTADVADEQDNELGGLEELVTSKFFILYKVKSQLSSANWSFRYSILDSANVISSLRRSCVCVLLHALRFVFIWFSFI